MIGDEEGDQTVKRFNWSGMSGSVLGFGCGSALGRVGRTDSLRAMDAAWNAGVNVFDVAPSYGFGAAEALVGEFLDGRRAEAVVVTKFGLPPRSSARRLARFKPLVRGLLKAVPAARSAVQRVANAEASPSDFDAVLVRPSVEASLRALRTDYLDVLLLHGPPEDAVGDVALLTELEGLVTAGLVRAVGLSGSPRLVAVADEVSSPLRVLQSNISPLDLANLDVAAGTSRLFMANHVFGGATGIERIDAVLAANRDRLPADLRRRAGRRDTRLIAEVALNVVLRDTGVHVAVPSMMNLEHLAANVAAVEHSELSDDDVDMLRQAFLDVDPVAV